MSYNGGYSTESSSSDGSGYQSGYQPGCGYSTDGSYSSGGLSILSTSTTYGTFGSWTGGDTHASGYEADVESNCSYK